MSYARNPATGLLTGRHTQACRHRGSTFFEVPSTDDMCICDPRSQLRTFEGSELDQPTPPLWMADKPHFHGVPEHIYVEDERTPLDSCRYRWCLRTSQDRSHVRSQTVGQYEQIESELESLERRADRLRRRLDVIEARPPEPELVDPATGPLVISFQARFNPGGRVYDYAAILADDGLWYTTGPQSPKGYGWDELMDWLEPKCVDGIWAIVGWEPL